MQENLNAGDSQSQEVFGAESQTEDLGLEIVEDTPQVALARPVRHIRQQ